MALKEEVLAKIHEDDPWYAMSSLKRWVYIQLKKREQERDGASTSSEPSRKVVKAGKSSGKPISFSVLALNFANFIVSTGKKSTGTAVTLVLEAMRVSNAFLLGLPVDGADDALERVAAMCQVDVASLRKFHASLHAQNSRTATGWHEPLPPLIIRTYPVIMIKPEPYQVYYC